MYVAAQEEQELVANAILNTEIHSNNALRITLIYLFILKLLILGTIFSVLWNKQSIKLHVLNMLILFFLLGQPFL